MSSGRRTFLIKASRLTKILIVAGALGACGEVTIVRPSTLPPASPILPTSTQAALSPGGYDSVGLVNNFKAEADPFAFRLKGQSGFVFNNRGELSIFSGICTHQGCEVEYAIKPGKFICPCHDSQYDKTGEVVKGPAKNRLPRFEFKIVSGELFVKTA